MAVGGDQTDEDTGGPVAPKRIRQKAETLDKRDLLRRVVTASGVSARDVRRVSDALLAEIGTAIDTGASLSLAPLGKMRTVRTSEGTASDVHTLRLRRTPAKAAAESGGDDESDVSPGTKARTRVKPGAAARATAGKSGAAGTERSVKPARPSGPRVKAVTLSDRSSQDAAADADWGGDEDED